VPNQQNEITTTLVTVTDELQDLELQYTDNQNCRHLQSTFSEALSFFLIFNLDTENLRPITKKKKNTHTFNGLGS
jgi:hypothetical protein